MEKQINSYYLEGIKRADNRIFDEIYRDFLPGIRRIIRQDGGTAEDAEDVFQLFLMQLYGRLKTTEVVINGAFRNYLITACRNLWKKELKKRIRARVTNQSSLELLGKADDMSEIALEQERWDFYEEKFQQLSENCIKVLSLRFKKELGIKEIMEQMSYNSEVTVRQRIFKCRAKLSEFIKGDKRFS